MASSKGLKGDAEGLVADLKSAKAALASLHALGAKGAAGEGFVTATAKAKSEVEGLTEKLKELKKAQADADQKAKDRPTPQFVKWIQEAAKGIKSGLETLKGVAKGDAESIKTALGAGGLALEKGATLAAQSAIAIGVATAGLVAGVVKLGVESSAAEAKQKRALGYLTRAFGESTGAGRGVGKQGDVAYRVTLALAGEKGIEPAKALERMRGLIDAKFGRAQAELLFRVSADLGEVKGEGQAEALLSQLEAVKRLDDKLNDARNRGLKYYRAIEIERGGAQAAALDRFGEAGIRASEVLKQLALKGESLQQVSLRLRRGRIDADAFAKAVATVAGKDVAGAAGKGLDATLNRLKIGFSDLFTGWDLTPLDEAGKKIDSALSSDAGRDLKKAIGEVGAAVLGLTGDLSEADLKAAFTSAAAAARDLVPYIRATYETFKDLVDLIKEADKMGLFEPIKAPLRELDALAKATADKPEPPKSAEEAGKAFDAGLAAGIDADLAKVKAAGARAGDAAAHGANEALGIRSPSRVAMEQGKYYGAGWEIGIDQGAPRVAAAARRLAGGVANAGAGSGGSAGGDAFGGQGSVVIHAPFAPVITVSGSATEADAERIRSVLADAYAGQFLPLLRLAGRDAREQAMGGG